MKKMFMLSLAILFVLGLSVAAFAGVDGSVHDMRLVVGGTELCGYCHTPHSDGRPEALDGPLWAHTQTDTTGYTMYSYLSPETAVTYPTAPDGVSLACLGCHDGSIAVDQYQGLNTGSTNTIDTVAPTAQVPNPAMSGSAKDLRGTHPISVEYYGYSGQVPPSEVEMNLPTASLGAAGTISSFLDQFGKVQCSTCHDVHDEEGVAGTELLRETNVNSAICVACHIK